MALAGSGITQEKFLIKKGNLPKSKLEAYRQRIKDLDKRRKLLNKAQDRLIEARRILNKKDIASMYKSGKKKRELPTSLLNKAIVGIRDTKLAIAGARANLKYSAKTKRSYRNYSTENPSTKSQAIRALVENNSPFTLRIAKKLLGEKS